MILWTLSMDRDCSLALNFYEIFQCFSVVFVNYFRSYWILSALHKTVSKNVSSRKSRCIKTILNSFIHHRTHIEWNIWTCFISLYEFLFCYDWILGTVRYEMPYILVLLGNMVFPKVINYLDLIRKPLFDDGLTLIDQTTCTYIIFRLGSSI